MSRRRILVSGSTGLIGRRFVRACEIVGDVVVPLVRHPAPTPSLTWDALDRVTASGFDAVVHLAGEPVTGGRWTAAKRGRIRDSRVLGTARLAAALAAADRPPAVFVCASGVNFYGDRGDTVVDEDTSRGLGFLADVCAEWEAASGPLRSVTRVVHLRIGVVLAAQGGPLATLVRPFRLGLGGPVAGGRPYTSWVTLSDTVRAIEHAIASERLAGPVNVVAPGSVTNGDFARALSRAVGRPAVIPVPAWSVRLAYGQLAGETVLTSIRATPRSLLADGFSFEHSRIDGALASVLGHDVAS